MGHPSLKDPPSCCYLMAASLFSPVLAPGIDIRLSCTPGPLNAKVLSAAACHASTPNPGNSADAMVLPSCAPFMHGAKAMARTACSNTPTSMLLSNIYIIQAALHATQTSIDAILYLPGLMGLIVCTATACVCSSLYCCCHTDLQLFVGS